jgi:hypothetical protein
MNKSLQPGDLALIIRSLDGHSTGKIVTCVQIDFIAHEKYGTIWLVKSDRNDLITEYGGVGNNFHVPQSWLLKIPKDPLPDEEDEWVHDPAKELVLIDK